MQLHIIYPIYLKSRKIKYVELKKKDTFKYHICKCTVFHHLIVLRI